MGWEHMGQDRTGERGNLFLVRRGCRDLGKGGNRAYEGGRDERGYSLCRRISNNEPLPYSWAPQKGGNW